MLQNIALSLTKNIESKLLYVHCSSLDLYAVITKTKCHHVNGDEISPFAQWRANLIEMPFSGKTHAKRRHHHTNGDEIFSFVQLWWANLTKMPLSGKTPVTSHQERHRRRNLLKPRPCRTHRHLRYSLGTMEVPIGNIFPHPHLPWVRTWWNRSATLWWSSIPAPNKFTKFQEP